MMKVFFFFNKTKFLLLQGCFFFGNADFQFHPLIHFTLLLFVQVAVSDIKSFQCCFCQFNTDFFIIFLYFKILLCFFCLAFKTL